MESFRAELHRFLDEENQREIWIEELKTRTALSHCLTILQSYRSFANFFGLNYASGFTSKVWVKKTVQGMCQAMFYLLHDQRGERGEGQTHDQQKDTGTETVTVTERETVTTSQLVEERGRDIPSEESLARQNLVLVIEGLPREGLKAFLRVLLSCSPR